MHSYPGNWQCMHYLDILSGYFIIRKTCTTFFKIIRFSIVFEEDKTSFGFHIKITIHTSKLKVSVGKLPTKDITR